MAGKAISEKVNKQNQLFLGCSSSKIKR
uniref:Uncharacterized protein n=1 Tax=Heterorhabditis bacteriophora TaxID=37862 RepID=A0A1I7WM05_HETBA